MSMYLRLKRKNETIFLHCEPTEKLQLVKERLGLIVGVDEDDIRLFEHLTPERRAALQGQASALAASAATRAAKLNKNPYQQPINNTQLTNTNNSSQSTEFQQPPLDCDKKIAELGLESDAVVFFVYRNTNSANSSSHQSTAANTSNNSSSSSIAAAADDWEPIDAEGYTDKKARGLGLNDER